MSEPRKSTARQRLSVAPPPPPPPRASVKLAVGDQVQIGDNEHFVAEVRFIGHTSFAEGEWVGVQCKKPIGKNDGSVQGVRYFECPANHGLFARAQNLVKVQASPPTTPAMPAVSATPRGSAPRSRASYAVARTEKDGGAAHSNGLLVPPNAQAEHLRKELAVAMEDHDFAKLRHVLPQACTRVEWREVESAWKLWDFEFCRLRDAEALRDKFLRQMKDIEEVRCIHMEEIQKEMQKGLAQLRAEVAGFQIPQTLREMLSESLKPLLHELSDLRGVVQSQAAKSDDANRAEKGKDADIETSFRETLHESMKPLFNELSELRALVTSFQASKADVGRAETGQEGKDREQQEAATKIQAVHRGNLARKETALKIQVTEPDVGSSAKGEETCDRQQQEEAATKIQAIHRGNVTRKEIHDKQIQEGVDKQQAATRIQAVHRGNAARKEVHDKKQEEAIKTQESRDRQEQEAATKIQAVHRGNDARKEVRKKEEELQETAKIKESCKQEDAATKIQAMHRGQVARKEVHHKKEEAEAAKIKETADQQEKAATTIQAVHRGNVTRKEIDRKQEDAAVKSKESKHKQEEEAATKIQAIHRGNTARKEVHHRQQEEADAKESRDRQQQEAATKIQATHRGNIARKEMRDRKQEEAAVKTKESSEQEAAIKIQAVHRGNVARKELHDKQREEAATKSKEEAATKIQAVHRGNLTRQDIQQKKQDEAASQIQASLRGNMAREEIQEKQQKEEAATKIQAVQRGKLARKEIQEKQQEEAATKIQASLRGNLARQEIQEKKEQQEAATKIQAIHRGNLARKAQLEVPRAPGLERRRSSHRLPKLTEVQWSHAVQVPACYKRGAVRVAETHRRAIRLSQLRALSELVEQVLQAVEVADPNPSTQLGRLTMQNVNLYHLNELFVLRLTAAEVCSFTELVMDGPQDPSWFVSHWWGTPWRDSLSILGFHAEVHQLPRESPYWICTFANNQHDLEELNTSDLLETPFVKAIMSPSCQGTVMLMNENAEPFRRTWCTLENFISTQHVQKKSTVHHFEVGAVVQEGMQKITVNDVEHRVPRCPALLQQGGDHAAGFIDKVAFEGAWFPNEVASCGVKVDIATANASNEDDKRNILRLIIGETDPAKMPEPPVQHDKYDEVNIAIHRVFAPMALHDAAQDGNVAEVERLLQAGLVDLAGKPTRNSAGETPLFAACANGRAAMVELLLANRADPNLAKSTDGVSPACAAAVGNHREVLELLLSHGANLNAASKDGGTPLLMCIQAGHYGLVERLLEAKADPNGDTHSTQTPVQFMTLASAHQSEEHDFDHACETLQLLLQARANPDSGTGASALLAAAGNDHLDALEILLEARADPNQRDPEYQATVLSWAAHNANVDAVTALIQHRADINAVSGGETPLDVAKGLLASDEPKATSAKACLEALKSLAAKEFKEL